MKVGIVTYVHGWYTDYIPFFIYSIYKSYPDYKPIILLRHELYDNTKKNLLYLRNKYKNIKFSIQEHVLPNIGNRNDPKYKPYYIRWLIPEYYFKGLDVAFICDIDLLMVHETPSLVEQRINVCRLNNLPFANYKRREHPPRITGWHFIEVDEYFNKTRKVINELRDRDIDITKLRHKYNYSNGLGARQWGQEFLLYYIINRSFGDDININHIFPTHHGIHLGPLRANLHKRLYSNDDEIVNKFGLNARYWYMYQAFQYANDETIAYMLKNLKPGSVKKIISRFCGDLNARNRI